VSYQPSYDPRRYKRSNRFLAGGCLRPFAEVLVANQFRSLAVRWTSRRPIGWSGPGPAMRETTSIVAATKSGEGLSFLPRFEPSDKRES